MGLYKETLLLLLLFDVAYSISKNDDLIRNLPGLTFKPPFRQYSGFFSANVGNYLHYWFVEAEKMPQWAPLFLFLGDGPGCSSIHRFFSEIGPFRPSADGKLLIQNPYSWNKVANLLVLDGPRDVGFSYRDPNYQPDDVFDDEKTASDNVIALLNFFERFPEYKNRELYIAGEGYGGVYAATLANYLIRLKDKNLDLEGINFAGTIVGNGQLNVHQQLNSLVHLLYYRWMIGKSEYEALLGCCPDVRPEDCDFSSFVTIDRLGNPIPKTKYERIEKCGEMVADLHGRIWNSRNLKYNTYQDCYEITEDGNEMKGKNVNYSTLLRSKALLASLKTLKNETRLTLRNTDGFPFVDQGELFNHQSTDPLESYPCYMDSATKIYLNREELRRALHIPASVPKWDSCNDEISGKYARNQDTTTLFQNIIKSGLNIRILFYNGNNNMANNFLGNEWFIENLAKKFTVVSPRNAWTYNRPQFPAEIVGFEKRWSTKNSTVDMVLVKGAGYLVSLDQPGPALQMINNFINKNNYNKTLPFSAETQPLLPEYSVPPPPSLTRKEKDRIWSLPGLTYKINFNQYSGYLNGEPGIQLHYWLVESQSNPSTDPLILWLNGGSGCSSMMSILLVHGPFHLNEDARTLYENIYAWNKAANIVYLEGPAEVGYSLRNTSVNPDYIHNDDNTAYNNFLALKDFFTVFPEYAHRPFYVMGHSYAGIFVPTLTSLFIDQVKAGNFSELNLAGIAIGNGQVSPIEQFNSAVHFGYFHGIYGKQEYDQLQQCCNTSAGWMEDCDLAQYVDVLTMKPKDPSGYCGKMAIELVHNLTIGSGNWVYNIYQDCYERKKTERKTAFVDQGKFISQYSTDSQGGLPCYGIDAMPAFLNQQDIRDALHIKPEANKWLWCNHDISYHQQYSDTGSVFERIIKSKHPLRILIFYGDLDLESNFIAGQKFTENLAKRLKMRVTQKYGSWMYKSAIGGYVKQFDFGTGTLDVMTIKGAGHTTGLDRPGPSLQMITNFLRSQNYSDPIPYHERFSNLTDRYVIQERLARDRLNEDDNASDQKKHTKNHKGPSRPPYTTKEEDLIVDLPGLTYEINFKQYSGYLEASNGNFLHYWLVESQSKPETDPLIVWFNGGPGCSSLDGFLFENGPFLVNSDGKTVFENVHSWNKFANVMYLESPREVGFSFRSNDVEPDESYNDTYTADDNVLAIASFMRKFPEYRHREFYITGESYAGVYIPTLTATLIRKIQDKSMDYVNLMGIGIGNGIVSRELQLNSVIPLAYYRGFYGREERDEISKCCNNSGTLAYCDFVSYIHFNFNGGSIPNYNDGSLAAKCGQYVNEYGISMIRRTENDAYNTYQDCYEPSLVPSIRKSNSPLPVEKPFVDQRTRINYQSTDSTRGLQCYSHKAIYAYLNQKNVQKALHIPEDLGKPHKECNSDLNSKYTKMYNYGVDGLFKEILDSGYNLRILLFVGDADMVCEFLGNEWFVEKFAKANRLLSTVRSPWQYTKEDFKPVLAGYVRTYSYRETLKIDLLTMKGAGHFIPTDRPGPVLQMIYNLIRNKDYSIPLNMNFERKPLLPQYLSTDQTSKVSRKDADEVFDLPGLTYDLNFKHYSGYLNTAVDGIYLHYWLVESQQRSAEKPLILWLDGGGKSSSYGLLAENGPFFVNSDGQTLFENVYSWNKAANVLYLDSPAQSGFSYQNFSRNPDRAMNEDVVAINAAAALNDFFNVFPNLRKNKLYIAGESNGSVYAAKVARILVKNIQENDIKINIAGILIGNGMFDRTHQTRTLPNFLYHHGIYGKEDYHGLRECCPQGRYLGLKCKYDKYPTRSEVISLRNHSCSEKQKLLRCAKAVKKMASLRTDSYNLNEFCYAGKGDFMKNEAKTEKIAVKANIFDPLTTDNFGGYSCFSQNAIHQYLNQEYVRIALNIPDFVQPWKLNSNLERSIDKKSPDVISILQDISESGYSLDILVYNGDSSPMANTIQSEWAIEEFATNNAFEVQQNHTHWIYRGQMGGYMKKFRSSNGNLSIYLGSVKGAGLMISADRPGPTLQLITNFLTNTDNNKPFPFKLSRRPLKPQFVNKRD